jgi:hypothetical protein
MRAHHKMSLHENRYETVHSHKYASTYNTCPIRMQAYVNKTLQMLNKTVDNEPMGVYYEF